jgi:serine/threonine protein kinase
VTGKIPEEPLEPLGEAHPGCDAPEELERVLFAALALEPEDRVQTADELGRALAAVGAAHPDRRYARDADRRSLRADRAGGHRGEGRRVRGCASRYGGHDVVLKFLRSTAPDEMPLRFAREAKLLSGPSTIRRCRASTTTRPRRSRRTLPWPTRRDGLRRVCARRLGCKPTEVAAVGVKLARVLAVVHARGVLHRDINANNVLIDERTAG